MIYSPKISLEELLLSFNKEQSFSIDDWVIVGFERDHTCINITAIRKFDITDFNKIVDVDKWGNE